MTALDEDPVFETIDDGWWLPIDRDTFLAWLRTSGVPGATDDERSRTFAGYPAAANMPASPKTALGVTKRQAFVVAWDGHLRFIVRINGGPDQLDQAVIVHVGDGSVSTVIPIGSMLVPGEPYDWRDTSKADPQLVVRATMLAASAPESTG